MPSCGRIGRRAFCAILLTGVLGLVLAGCASNSKDSAAPGGNRLLVTDVQSIVGDTNILLGWTNPDQDNITGFQITPHVVVDGSVGNESLAVPRSFTSIAGGPGFSDDKGARVTYDITDLTRNTTYEVVIGVIYGEDAENPQNLRLAKMTTGDPDTEIGDDFDGDKVDNGPDAFPTDACATVDEDGDGQPDSFLSGCTAANTTLILDDDGGFPPVSVDTINAVPAGNNITVSWTNPNRKGNGFNINWMNIANATDEGTKTLSATESNVDAGASNTYTIEDLGYITSYRIRVAVIYDGRDEPMLSAPVIGVTEAMPGSVDSVPMPPVSNLTLDLDDNAIDESAIIVSWDNPAREDITGFRVAWVDDDGEEYSMSLDDPEASTYTIEGLEYNANYTIAVTVLYDDGVSPAIILRIEIGSAPVLPAPDSDDDGVADADDVDYDGDGLIEIRNLDQLALLSDDLNGNGTDGDMGCPDTGCIGHELTRSLDFSDPNSYADAIADSDNMVAWTSGDGWEPITSCIVFDCDAYTGIFEGNNFNISNLFIGGTSSTEIGLFAIFSGSIRNLNLLDADVTAAGDAIGLLVGKGLNGGRYDNLSVSGTLTAVNSQYVGGLIGESDGSKINRVYMASGSVSGDRRVGGLVGLSRNATSIRHSYVSDVAVKGDRGFVGGLVGSAEDTGILYSYASNVSVFGDSNAGGLVGFGTGTNIYYSYAVDGKVSAIDDSIGRDGGFGGGLIGDADGSSSDVNISYSYAAVRNITGGLAGRSSGSFNIIDSYWDVNTTSILTGGDLTNKTTVQLQTPARISDEDRGFTGIYEFWGDLLCDPDTGDVMESSDGSIPADSRFTSNIWDLGNRTQYPALKCVVGGLEAQRR